MAPFYFSVDLFELCARSIGLKSNITDIITEYRTIIDIYHKNKSIIKNQIKACLDQTRTSIVGFHLINKY
jgi:hypothetical protein